MSQGSTGLKGSSTEELKNPHTAEAERVRRRSEGRLLRVPGGVEADDEFSKEERLERALKYMEESEPFELDVSMGEIVKIDEELILERTENGFNAYVVMDER